MATRQGRPSLDRVAVHESTGVSLGSHALEGVLVTRRERLFVAIAIIGMLAGAAGWIYNFDGRKGLELDAFLSPSEKDKALDVTEERCGRDVHCSEALKVPDKTLYRFESWDAASAAAAYLGDDARLAGYIVVEFDGGGLSAEERASFMFGIYCTNVSKTPCS